MDVSLQKDFGRFSARWGCFFTCLVNIIELERKKIMTPFDRAAAIGATFQDECIWMSNYKNHELIAQDKPEKNGWGDEADPEIHFWVNRMSAAIQILMKYFKIGRLRLHHKIQFRYLVNDAGNEYGGHFILKNETGTYNPDPSLMLGSVRKTYEVDL